MKPLFLEVDHHQERKYGQAACGDVFLSRKPEGDHRVISVLADGLGSGIKASVLATLTSTMAIRYMASDMDMRKAAGTIMATLPVCSERQIAYSTFTIVDMDPWGATRILEYDNPRAVLMRGPNPVPSEAEILPLPETAGPGGGSPPRPLRGPARGPDGVLFRRRVPGRRRRPADAPGLGPGSGGRPSSPR